MWRKFDETLLDSFESMIRALTAYLAAGCDMLERPLEFKAFDEALRASAAYARIENAEPTAKTPVDDLEHLFEQDATNPGPGAPWPTEPHRHSEPSDEPADESGFAYSDIHTMTSSFATHESLAVDPHADRVEKPVLVLKDREEAIPLMLLLDTGATVNCIAAAHVKAMRSGSNMKKLTHVKSIEQADSSYIDATYVLKCTWQFQGKQKRYTNNFYVLPDLPRDLIICRRTIFEHGFLTDNPELCSLGLPRELKCIPELYVLGMSAQNKAQKQNQSLKAKQKQKANAEETRKQMEEMKQQFAERFAAAIQTTTSWSQASGSSSETGASSNRS